MIQRAYTRQVPQRHLGPIIFPVDRVLAILGILLEEYDADYRPPAPEYKLPGEYSDMEIRRVSTHSGVCQQPFWSNSLVSPGTRSWSSLP